ERTKTGVPPTPRKARTGELTPPGRIFSARSNRVMSRTSRRPDPHPSFSWALPLWVPEALEPASPEPSPPSPLPHALPSSGRGAPPPKGSNQVPPLPGGCECVWERGLGGEDSGEAGPPELPQD